MIAMDLVSQQPFRFGFAWVLLSVALTLHVTDEALSDFLSVYNPAVRAYLFVCAQALRHVG